MDPGPTSFYDLMGKDYRVYVGNRVHHDGREQIPSISTLDLVEGQSIGCCITRDGDLEIYINRQKKAVGMRNVPMDEPLWGVVDILRSDVIIQSEFYCGELYL